ncbi:hypothetical protein BWD10_07455 [Neisseria zoodegmatis]|uniref:Uncharacterized protein n=2 Tax=Neisseria zoodegmatis TaxID=326523 RepID=A0ABX3WF63_9NEIS|nr:hypothetical protein BWD10_07455 [Neisseria zoodegmatis]
MHGINPNKPVSLDYTVCLCRKASARHPSLPAYPLVFSDGLLYKCLRFADYISFKQTAAIVKKHRKPLEEKFK